MGEIVEGFLQAIDLIVSLDPEVLEITWRTLYISLSSTLLATLIALPVAGLIASREFPGKRGLMYIVQTLYSLPTVIIGLLLFLLISSSGPFGELDLLFTPGGMIIGQALLILPILIGLTIAALAAIDPLIRDTLASLGATGWQQLLALLREARFAILAVVALAFGRAISEVGVAIMIGGNIRGYTRVLTTAISLETSMGNISLSIALGIILLIDRAHRERRRQPPAGRRALMIRCEALGWDAGEKTVLDGITLEVAKGESFGLIGPSGGGKSCADPHPRPAHPSEPWPALDRRRGGDRGLQGHHCTAAADGHGLPAAGRLPHERLRERRLRPGPPGRLRAASGGRVSRTPSSWSASAGSRTGGPRPSRAANSSASRSRAAS